MQDQRHPQRHRGCTQSIVTPALVAVALSLLLAACQRQDDSMLRELTTLESPEYGSEGVSDQRIRELQQAIREFEEIVERRVEASEQLGVYHRMLAVEYIRRSMYGLALDHLQQAIEIEPENPVLFYWAGVAAGRFSKAMAGRDERDRYLERAEFYYRRAIALNPRYAGAYYALAVLYVFELERPAEAEPLLEEVLRRQSRNVQAMALLAHVYAATGRLDQAARMYGEVAETTDDEAIRREAIRNRDQVREAMR
ncbi:MAG: hypothetical protein EA384_05275 [Spirochaetaceae bacterium]|nr:MAG: hypothetical protein EA384_05275 [Spirochaetaceae bacterium]